MIILMPGLNGTAGLFKPLIDAKPDQVEIVTITYPTDKALSYVELTEYVLKKIEPIKDDYLLVGESFSGPLSLFVANKKPKNLIGVVLVASFIRAPNLKIGQYLPWFLGFKLTKPLFKLLSLLSKTGNMSFTHAISTELQSVKSHVLADRIKSIFLVNAYDALKNCHVPIAYFLGTKDMLVPKKNLSDILIIRKDVKVYEFQTQHFLLQAAPVDAWKAIEAFIEGKY